MPTPLTHGLVGAAFAQAAPEGISKWRMAAVFGFLGVLPDFDLLTHNLGISYNNIFGHRGFSHSLVFAVGLGVVMSLICVWFKPKNQKAALVIAPLAFLAVAAHGFLDAATNGGLGVGFFIPFDQTRYFFGFRPILVSPFSPVTFLERAYYILLSEILWVWLPVAAASFAFQSARYAVTRIRIPMYEE